MDVVKVPRALPSLHSEEQPAPSRRYGNAVKVAKDSCDYAWSEGCRFKKMLAASPIAAGSARLDKGANKHRGTNVTGYLRCGTLSSKLQFGAIHLLNEPVKRSRSALSGRGASSPKPAEEAKGTQG